MEFDFTSPSTWGKWAQENGWLSSVNDKGIKTQGLLDSGIGIGSAILQGLMGWQNYNLAKDQFDFQKDAFNKNYAAQKTLTNSSLEDRQRARVSSNPTAYQSVGEYMKQYGVA